MKRNADSVSRLNGRNIAPKSAKPTPSPVVTPRQHAGELEVFYGPTFGQKEIARDTIVRDETGAFFVVYTDQKGKVIPGAQTHEVDELEALRFAWDGMIRSDGWAGSEEDRLKVAIREIEFLTEQLEQERRAEDMASFGPDENDDHLFGTLEQEAEVQPRHLATLRQLAQKSGTPVWVLVKQAVESFAEAQA